MAGENLKILITGSLNVGRSIGEINTQIKALEKKINKIRLNIQLDEKVSKTLANFSKAMDNHKKIAQDLNRVMHEEKVITKEANGVITESIRQHLKDGDVRTKNITKINEQTKATQSGTQAIKEQNKELQRQGELAKNKYKTDPQGNRVLNSQVYKDGSTTTTYNNQTGTSSSVRNIEQENKATQNLVESKRKLRQEITQLNKEGKLSADNFAKLNRAIDNSKNIQQTQKLQQNLQNLNRIQENQHRIQMAQQQAQVNVQRLRTTHGGFVNNGAIDQYLSSINQLNPRVANLTQHLQRAGAQWNQLAQNTRSAAGASQQAGMSFSEMFQTAAVKFPVEVEFVQG